MCITVAPEMVPRDRDLTHELWVLLRYPAKDEKGSLYSVPVQELKRLRYLNRQTRRQSLPLTRVDRSLDLRGMKVLFDIDRQNIGDEITSRGRHGYSRKDGNVTCGTSELPQPCCRPARTTQAPSCPSNFSACANSVKPYIGHLQGHR